MGAYAPDALPSKVGFIVIVEAVAYKRCSDESVKKRVLNSDAVLKKTEKIAILCLIV